MDRKSLAGLVLLGIVGVGCSDSGTPVGVIGSPSSTVGAPSSDGAPPLNGDLSPAVGVNGPLTGEVWVTERSGTERVNLQTGNAIKVSDARAIPSRDGSFYIEYLQNYGRVPIENCIAVINTDTHKVNLRDTRTSEILNSFVIDRKISWLRLSPDGKRIAMFVAEIATESCEDNDSNLRFSVFSTDGEELFRIGNVDVHAYDWHPDGRLVVVRRIEGNNYAVDIESAVGSYQFEPVWQFNSGDGVIYYEALRVGPSGNDAVIEAVYGTPVALSGFTFREARAHHFNLYGESDETAIFQQSDEEEVNSPVISPDGKYIMVTNGYIGGGLFNYSILPDTQVLSGTDLKPEISLASAGGITYVVPVGVKGQQMPPQSFSETMRPVLSKNLVDSLVMVGFNPIDGYSWTPAID